jgi:hypothetical protein
MTVMRMAMRINFAFMFLLYGLTGGSGSQPPLTSCCSQVHSTGSSVAKPVDVCFIIWFPPSIVAIGLSLQSRHGRA